MSPPYKIGDYVINFSEGHYVPSHVRNPDRKWWQFWKPKTIPNPMIGVWEVISLGGEHE